MNEGDVVICATGQAGTCTQITGDSIEILLRSGELWHGPKSQCRLPQSEADLAAAPVDVERPEPKRKRSK